MRNVINKHVSSLVKQLDKQFLILFFLSMLNLFFMHGQILLTCKMERLIDITSFFDNFLACFADTFLTYLLILVFSWGRVKVSLIITFFVTLLWSFSNVFYSRFFSQYLSLSAITQVGSLGDDLVFKSMLAGFELYDVYYIIILLLVPFIIAKGNAITSTALGSVKFLTIGIIAIVILVISSHAIYVFSKPDLRYVSYFMHKLQWRYATPKMYNSVYPNWVSFHRGTYRTVVFDNFLSVFASHSISREQMSEIEAAYKDHSMRTTGHTINSNIENVIFIIVESYLSVTSDLVVDGKEITPFLNKLKREDNVYYNGHMRSNVSVGESSDGQFIYMTGILPLSSEVTVSYAKHNTIFSLPKMVQAIGMGMNSKMVIPTAPTLWEQQAMNTAYGIDRLYSNTDYNGDINGGDDNCLTDEQIFSLAERTDQCISQPFFSMILTMSMHQPYNDCTEHNFRLTDSGLPLRYRNYLTTCHYFDMQIEKYISHLKRNNLYDNSLIIIAADHEAHPRSLDMDGKVSANLPLYIINGNIDKGEAWTGEFDQLDVYTTILDVLGVESEWRGLGHTLLTKQYKPSVTDKSKRLSEWIIYGDYFKRYTDEGKVSK